MYQFTYVSGFFTDFLKLHYSLGSGPAPRRRFAVRQWPGNEADLNFVGVIARANAVLLVSQSLAEVAALDFQDCAAGRAVVPEAVGRVVAFKRVRPRGAAAAPSPARPAGILPSVRGRSRRPPETHTPSGGAIAGLNNAGLNTVYCAPRPRRGRRHPVVFGPARRWRQVWCLNLEQR